MVLNMKKLPDRLMLLHVCCAPCSTHVIEELRDSYDLTCYFYNPNIHPQEEYVRRLGESEDYVNKIDAKFNSGPYDPDRWLDLTEELKYEKEGGKRCELCYKIRLEETARFASQHGFDFFATTLSISPHKKASVINKIGSEIAKEYDLKFLDADFKKGNGFKRSVELSKAENMHRQDYCGCVYSKQERDARRSIRGV